MSVSKSGSAVVGSVDLESLEKMKNEYEAQITKSRTRGKVFCQHRQEYRKLLSRLESLTDKTSHQVMVPFTKKAFMPGTLVHTNEILVLLGDNWFAERSAKQAREICNRRLQHCEETLSGLDREIGLFESWFNEANRLKSDTEQGEGNIEIREDYDEEELKRWRQQRKEKVREAKVQENREEKVHFLDDEEYWKRLEELELKEELDEYLEKNEEKEEDEAEDESDEDIEDESYTEYDSEPGYAGKVKFAEDFVGHSSIRQQMEEELDRHFAVETAGQMSQSSDRKVSFGSNTEHIISSRHNPEPSIAKNVIQFDHTKSVSQARLPQASAPVSPGDLLPIFGAKTTGKMKKSILKQSSFSDLNNVRMSDEVIFSNDHGVGNETQQRMTTLTAISDIVQERDVSVDNVAEAAPPSQRPPKQSLFKRSRR